MLIHKTYHTSKYEVFEKKEGKKIRKVYKLPYFPDRICQWAIIQVIEPYLMRILTDDTYSALPGRGVERARRKMVRALKQTLNTVWCLKIDISKYYPNVNIEKLNLSIGGYLRITTRFGCLMRLLIAIQIQVFQLTTI